MLAGAALLPRRISSRSALLLIPRHIARRCRLSRHAATGDYSRMVGKPEVTLPTGRSELGVLVLENGTLADIPGVIQELPGDLARICRPRCKLV
jgi:hypothetical protein